MGRSVAFWAILMSGLILAACTSATAEVSISGGAVDTATPAVGRPTAPAPLDQYRADSAADVGATGRPQLIEFFAYW